MSGYPASTMVKAPQEKSSLFKKQFIRRVKEIYGNSPPSSADEIITGLVNIYPDYRRQKPLPLTAMAKQALASKSLKRSNDDYSMTPPEFNKPSLKEKEPINNNLSDGDGTMFKDLGGMDGVLDELKNSVLLPFFRPELPRFPLLTWSLAFQVSWYHVAPFVVRGASEENIRKLFTKANRTAPSIVFIDEIDAIASKRENLQREMERRIVTQLMTCMDEPHRVAKPDSTSNNTETTDGKAGYVLVIAATNRPDALDSALRRPGRFDHEITLGVPDEKARVQILATLTSSLKLEGAFDLVKISRATPGFVGADLSSLVKKAGNVAIKRIIDERKLKLSKENTDSKENEDWLRKAWTPEETEKLSITMSDFEVAAKLVQPSSKREGFSSIPNVRWEDVGGYDQLRRVFDLFVVNRIKYPDVYEEHGAELETGFLLYGPPGCGKTLIAKAVANEAGANFIHIKGPELLSKYVGESELAVRTIFSRARTCSPCILFFDEVDSLTTNRGREGGWVVERLLDQLLIELDGGDQRKGVYVIGATNRPDVMDRALLRPGRFGKLLYVPLPNPDERGLILKTLARKKPIDTDVDLVAIGRSDGCANFSGADLSLLMNEAVTGSLEEKLNKIVAATKEGTSGSLSESLPHTIKATHFYHGMAKTSPSVSKEV
ncbi:cell division control protein 48 homolog C-like protein [Tanacetum coccineum]